MYISHLELLVVYHNSWRISPKMMRTLPPQIPKPIVTSPNAPKESHLANLTAKESESVNDLFLGDVGKIFGQLKPQGTRYEIC